MVWYVAYGSNLLAERFHSYLTGSDASSPFGAHPAAPSTALPVDEHWLWIDHALYFAGVSKRWTGSAAFVSPEAGSGESIAHAYLIEDRQFAHLVAVENAVDAIGPPSPSSVDIGRYAILDIDHRGENFRGKYDALLRLPDIDGTPAVTVTSSTMRERGNPVDRYLNTIRRGVESSPFEVDVDTYLADAIARSATISVA
nr:hypothetical protein [Rhodococcus sp. (in: high G+C Gram-positive bacteria)]